MSEPQEISALEVLEALADGQRRLWEFTKQQMLMGRRDAACAITQGVLQAAAFQDTLRAMGDDYDVDSEDCCRLLDYANGEREK